MKSSLKNFCIYLIILFSSIKSWGQITCSNPSSCGGAQSDAAKFKCKVYENANYQGENLPTLDIGEYARMYLTPGTYVWSASGTDGNCGSIVKLELQWEGVGAYVYTTSACNTGTINTTDGQASGIYIQLVVHPCMEGWYLLGTTVNSGVLSGCNNCSGNINGWSNSYSCPTAPTITTQPSNASKCSSGSASFTVAATGASSYQWQYSSDNTNWTNVTNGTPTNATYSGATSTSLTINGSISGGPYYYRCKTVSSGGCIRNSNSATLTTNTNASTTNPSITAQSTCQNGAALPSLTVSGSGSPTLTYSWYTNAINSNIGGTFIPGATSSSYSPPNSTVGTVYYYCVVSNSCNSVTSAVSGAHTVNSNPSAPATPTTNSPNCTNVTLTGNPPTASWYWQGTNASGTSTASPTTSSSTVSLSGTYYVRAFNGSCWSSSTSVSVTIKTASTAPTGATASSGTVCSGGSSTLTVTGGSLGTGASWRWYTGSCGGTLVGTGASLSASPSTTTTYFVRAEGDCNNTACQSVTVIVDAGAGPTVPTISGTSNFCIGSSVTLTPNFPTGGTITNTGGFNYHVFTSNGSFTPAQSWRTETIIVAGGGGGGTNGGGGGVAGGVIYNPNDVVNSGANAVVVGVGGASGSPGINGGNSSFDGATAIGGGGGASRDAGAGGQNGGSGGGGAGTSEAGSGSASATYSLGNTNTQFVANPTTATNSSCPTDLSVTIPSGATITSVNVSYTMEAIGSGWRSEQRSYVQCTNPGGSKEATIYSVTGDAAGVQAYSRTGLTIANGVSGGGTINFRLHAFRTYEGTAGCNASVNRVNNNTFSITVNYNLPSPTRSLAGTGTSGQGNNGGNGTSPDQGCNSAGGGGGGAGGAGTAAANNVGGNGGAGVQYAGFSAVSAVANGWFGGGGGGGGTNFLGCGGSGVNPSMGAGGNGGGGSGETSNGVANSGGGGGAERSGGSGVVIIKYPTGSWSSSNTSVATVNSSTGVVNGVGVGTATITYTVSNGTCTNSSSFVVTITGPATNGLSANDYVWLGSNSTSWQNTVNWLVFNGTNLITTSSLPTTSNNVTVKPVAGCIINQPTVDGAIATIDASGSNNCKDLIIESGATLTMGANRTLNVAGNWTNLSTTSASFGENTGTVVFTAANKNLNSNVTGGESFFNLTSNLASTLTINNNVLVSNSLSLSGVITTGPNLFHLTNSSSDVSSLPINTGHVNGTLRRTIASNTFTYSFPVGNGTTLTSNRFLLEFINNNLTGVTELDCFVNAINESGNEDDPLLDTTVKCMQFGTALSEYLESAQWDLSPVSGSPSGNYGVRLYLANISNLSSVDNNRFAVVKRNSSSINYNDWDAFSASTTIPSVGSLGRICNNSATDYAQKNGFNSFSKFGIAKARIFTSPLPVKLSSLEVSCDKDIKKLSWKTLKESNCNLYVIEGSTDGLNYEEIKQLDCENNPNGYSYYYETNDNKNYFKLKQIDFDGNYEYFGPVYANCNNNEINSIKIFPNPNNGEQINIQLYNTLDSDVTYSVYNALGQVIYNGNFKTGQQLYQINLEKKLSNGIYFIRLQDNSFSFIVNSKE